MHPTGPSKMAQETRATPECIATQLRENADQVLALAAQLKGATPTHVVTVARGSSDHAAGFFSHMVMSRLGLWCTSLPLSMLTLESAPLLAAGVAAFAFSQSGRSPDLLSSMNALRSRGAQTFAFLNAIDAPLGQSAEHVIALHAGAESSVAATKSFVAQCVAAAHLTANWLGDQTLLRAIQHLPNTLEQSLSASWEENLDVFTRTQRMYVIGRGAGLAIAQEIALKLKETCSIQAAAYSGAELKHGPITIVEAGYPVLVLALRGPTQSGLISLAHELHALGADVRLVVPDDARIAAPFPVLSFPAAPHAALDGISAVTRFYLFGEAAARARGLDPDVPRNLRKVTMTH
jgi:glucosamine--fructose-6-phosphate aminotransferase (isomerizing)